MATKTRTYLANTHDWAGLLRMAVVHQQAVTDYLIEENRVLRTRSRDSDFGSPTNSGSRRKFTSSTQSGIEEWFPLELYF
jgi:hypothetical protein